MWYQEKKLARMTLVREKQHCPDKTPHFHDQKSLFGPLYVGAGQVKVENIIWHGWCGCGAERAGKTRINFEMIATRQAAVIFIY